MRNLTYVIFTCLLVACGSDNSATSKKQSEEPTTTQPPSITQLWSSDTTLRTPESVLLDRDRNVIYVANVNMNPWEKDGNGFISRLDMQGKVIDLKWVEGLHGPKGMGIVDRSLFVADIDQVVEIDMETGNITQRYPVEGKPTLNDITTLNGVVYISGSDSHKLFKLENGSISLILEGDLGRPNGLYAEVERLLMLTSTSSVLESINWQTMERTQLVADLGHGDGIVPAGDGSYLASSWRGELFFIDAEMKKYSLLNTEAQEINAADIDYSIEKNMLLVPTFFDNRVVAYSLTR